MAGRSATAWKSKGRPNVPRSRALVKVLTAASQRINLESTNEAQRQRLLRQNWQLMAWSFFDSIPELGFAIEFRAHSAARMRYYVAALSEGGESDLPLAIDDPVLEAPPQVIEACTNALRDLGNGRIELANFFEMLSINTSVAGECFLLGQQDPLTGNTTWSVRSIEEIVIYNDQVMLREGPMTNVGLLGLVPLDPDLTIVVRMWKQHPRFRLLAQSEMRRLASTCEDLLILRRIIRATGRSRLAGRGILLIPAELDIPILNDDNASQSGDDFISKLTDAMIVPIRNEGDASGVVPLVIEGPAEVLEKVRWIDFVSEFDKQAGETRAELVGVLAAGLDLPKEVVEGVMSANHWTANLVSTDTFRLHIEPHVITLCDMTTGAYLRPYFANCGLEPADVDAWVQRIVLWYDPTELVTPTDLTKTALDLADRGAISNRALRRVSGFTDEDAPTADEFLAWLISKQRTWPANLSLGVVHGISPELSIPPIETAGTIPGIKPGPSGGVDVGTPVAAAPVTSEPALTASSEGSEVVGHLLRMLFFTERQGYAAPALEETIIETITAAGPTALTQSSKPSPRSLLFSRQSVKIDQDLMARLKVAANDAVLRQLEKAGQRLRQKVNSDKDLRTKIAHSRNEHVMMLLGQEAVERKGLTAANLLESEWDSLREQYYSWTGQAQKAALEKARLFIGGDEQSTARTDIELAAGLAAGWALFKSSIDTIVEHAAYNPDPNIDAEAAIALLNPDAIVPTGVVRAAISVAGGASPSNFALTTLANGATVPLVPITPVGGIGTGQALSDYLTSQGASQDGYTWEHGSTDRPFDPHLDLDGVEFGNWDSTALANDGDWPPTPTFFPGDHDGCTCQAVPNWVSASDLPTVEG